MNKFSSLIELIHLDRGYYAYGGAESTCAIGLASGVHGRTSEMSLTLICGLTLD